MVELLDSMSYGAKQDSLEWELLLQHRHASLLDKDAPIKCVVSRSSRGGVVRGISCFMKEILLFCVAELQL